MYCVFSIKDTQRSRRERKMSKERNKIISINMFYAKDANSDETADEQQKKNLRNRNTYPNIECDSFVGNDAISMRPSSSWFTAERFAAIAATVRSIHFTDKL